MHMFILYLCRDNYPFIFFFFFFWIKILTLKKFQIMENIEIYIIQSMIVFDEFNEISVLSIISFLLLSQRFPICPLKLFRDVFYIIFGQTFFYYYYVYILHHKQSQET